MDTPAEKSSPAGTILEAALHTLAEHKISGARLRQIARLAGMSQGNLHYYFPSKDELYQALLDHLLAIFVNERKAVLEDPSIPPQEKLHFFFDQQIELIRRRQEVAIFFDFWVQGTKDPEIRAKIQAMYARWRQDVRAVIDEGVQAGVFSGAQAAQVPALLASLMDGASLQFLADESAIDLRAYFEGAYGMVIWMLELRE